MEDDKSETDSATNTLAYSIGILELVRVSYQKSKAWKIIEVISVINYDHVDLSLLAEPRVLAFVEDTNDFCFVVSKNDCTSYPASIFEAKQGCFGGMKQHQQNIAVDGCSFNELFRKICAHYTCEFANLIFSTTHRS